MVRFLKHRIADRRLLRLIGEWLDPRLLTRGTPRGVVISPVMANIYLHYVYDLLHQWRWRIRLLPTDLEIRSVCERAGAAASFLFARMFKRGAVISSVMANIYLHYVYDLWVHWVHHWRRRIGSVCERAGAAASLLFAAMFKRFRANFLLWPEQARPRREHTAKARRPALAAGAVCAIAAYIIMSDFVGPVTVREPAAQSHVFTFAPAVAPAVTSAPEQVETVHRRSLTRARTAKVTLPIIGSQAAVPSGGTDGRGGEGLPNGASVVALATSSGNPPSLIEGEPALQPPAEEAGTGEVNPAAASERPVKLRKKIIREKRERTHWRDTARSASGRRLTWPDTARGPLLSGSSLQRRVGISFLRARPAVRSPRSARRSAQRSARRSRR